MWLDPTRWLETLRQSRRAMAVVLLPALALSAMSGAACATATHDATSSHAGLAHVVDEHGAHHGAAHDEQPAERQSGTCPHCPLENGAAPLSHASCTVVDGQDAASNTVQPNTTLERPPAFALLPAWTLPAARAAPPLIGIPTAARTPLPSSVPLNVRHCVYLI